MTYSPGRNIGRVSIRVLPDTRGFNRDLKKSLTEISKTTHASIHASIANPKEFEHEVKKMVREASRNKVDITANAFTATAAAQLRYTARDRFVTFFAKVNETSLKKASTTLAALSGARLAYTWVDDLADIARNLDKNLPKILGWTTGITSLVASLFAATSGLVGIGAGMFSITPALLVLPGLVQNAVGSFIALFVAWRDAGDQLAPLADGMNELGEIINTTYWDRARQPILDLVNGLMPQLRNAFRDLSEGVGDFTGALADAFGRELSGGRLESIFKGIADGWRVLGTGADGFAGAIVSLSQIAATYTPRLARWFVRQANTFDAFLKSIAEDGRLDLWMEGAIKSMYDLWDATTGIAGVFEGIWIAAESAGSGGLAGFADLMQTWEATVKSADFQRGLSAVFRGSYDAMSSFGDAIRAVGRLVSDLDSAFEGFISASGGFLGGLVEAAADALNSVSVEVGLEGLSSGLLDALEGIKPSLQPIADTFGDFLGLLGDLAAELLPTAVGAISDLMPAVSSLMGTVERVLPGLSDAVTSVVDSLAPAIEDLVDALGPSLESIFGTLSEALEDIGPKMADLADGLSPALVTAMDALATALDPITKLSGGLLEIPQVAGEALKNGLGWLFDDAELDRVVDEIKKNGGWTGDLFNWADSTDDAAQRAAAQRAVAQYTALIEAEFAEKGAKSGQKMWNTFLGSGASAETKQAVKQSLADLGIEVSDLGISGGGGFSRGLAQGITGGLPGVETSMGGVKSSIDNSTSTAGAWLRGRGGQVVDGFRTAADGRVPGVAQMFGGIGGRLSASMGGSSTWLRGRGSQTMGGFKAGADSRTSAVKGVFSGLRGSITGTFRNPLGLLWSAGNSILGGLLNGLRSKWGEITSFVAGIAPWIRDNKGPEAYDRQLLVEPGEWIMSGLEQGLERGFGRVQSRVAGMADQIRGEFGTALGSGISDGVSSTMRIARAAAATSPVKQKQTEYATDGDSSAAPVQVTFVNPVVRDLEQEAWEAAQIIGGARV
ncbi:hypothetical protein [Microbacterium sp. C7(2022)]|uniref:phage tail protein n=1 Tax=Microbacterium sp. C7(2022) TaxID=2992759 RepID=UPI00237BFBAD|nr:hypothetical protein [Microbacterium sp. C7(2022)]MDE0545448.1 hypothetical protein [Microbacterium sp. C7(2022)]